MYFKKTGVILFLACLNICCTHVLSAQVFRPQGFEPTQSIFRKILSKVELNIETGYGYAFHNHTIGNSDLVLENGVNYLQPNFLNAPRDVFYNTWYQSANPITSNGSLTTLPFTSETNSAKAKGRGQVFPINFSFHVDVKRFRIGVGYNFYNHRLNKTFKFQNIEGEPEISTNASKFWNRRFYAYFGYGFKFFRYWTHTPELRIGRSIIKSLPNASPGIYIDFGVAIEHHLSENFRVRIRPSFEYLKYTGNNGYSVVTITRPTLYLTAGVSFNLAAFPKCKVAKCEARFNHVHPWKSTKEYRSKINKFFQIQNPLYGENHRTPRRRKS